MSTIRPSVTRRQFGRGCWAALAFGATAAVDAEEWRQFRGPRGLGHGEIARAPLQWNAFRNIVWQTPLPGSGCSSPIIVDDRIWLTAADVTALTEEARAKIVENSPIPLEEFQTHGAVTAYALELDGKSGRLLRKIPLLDVKNPAPIHAWNHYASPTSATDGKRLVCHFGSLGTVALDAASGELLWKKRFEIDEVTGPGGSPIVVRDRVFLACDGRDRQFVVALDITTGQEIWRTPRPPIDVVDDKHKRAFSTPIVIEESGEELLVSAGAQWLVAYELLTGRERWRVNIGEGHAVVPMPTSRKGFVYSCTGYPKPQMWAVRTGGRGDVTDSHVAWIYDRQVPELASPVVVGDDLYFVSMIGVATCLNADTGERRWQQRLGGGYSASPIAIGEQIYFTAEDGAVTVVKAGQKYEAIGGGRAPGIHQATPAIYAGGILFRSSEGIYYVRER